MFVSVELTVERCYFANLVDEIRFEADTKALALYNLQHEVIGKVNRKAVKFKRYKQVESLGTSIRALEEGASL